MIHNYQQAHLHNSMKLGHTFLRNLTYGRCIYEPIFCNMCSGLREVKNMFNEDC